MANNTINLLPRLTEKTYSLSATRVYVVDLDKTISKQAIKTAFENQFAVKVKSVNTANINGKKKRSISKNGRRVSNGSNKDIHKAYVTLVEGDSLPFFEAIEEEEKKTAKVQAEFDKQQEKADKPKKLIGRRKKTAKEDK